MIPNKVIFLDVDGVLNNESRSIIPEDEYLGIAIDPLNLKILKDIYEKHCFSIVLSSTWRLSKESTEALINLLDKEISINLIIGKTEDLTEKPTRNFMESRKNEILDYVKREKLQYWLAIDDWDLNLHKNNFVKTDPKIGLDEKCKFEIIQIILTWRELGI